MSGLTLAVGARREQRRDQDAQDKAKEEGSSTRGWSMGSLSTIKLQLVAFILVFSASGLVPVVDLLFPVFVSAYVYVLSRFVFPVYPIAERSELEVFQGSRMFDVYVSLGTVIGLFLPLAYVLGGFARGDQQAVSAATPHLFLLSVQILSEMVISSLSLFSPPVRVILTLLYTTRHIIALSHWVIEVLTNTKLPPEPGLEDFLWLWFGRLLAAANFIYFSINMFCFLIPRFLQRAFERYLEAKNRYKYSHTGQSSLEGKEKDKSKAVYNSTHGIQKTYDAATSQNIVEGKGKEKVEKKIQ